MVTPDHSRHTVVAVSLPPCFHPWALRQVRWAWLLVTRANYLPNVGVDFANFEHLSTNFRWCARRQCSRQLSAKLAVRHLVASDLSIDCFDYGSKLSKERVSLEHDVKCWWNLWLVLATAQSICYKVAQLSANCPKPSIVSSVFCRAARPRIVPQIRAGVFCFHVVPQLSASRLASRSTSSKFRVLPGPCWVFCMLKIVVAWLGSSKLRPASSQSPSTVRRLSCGILRAPSSLSIVWCVGSILASIVCSCCVFRLRWRGKPNFVSVFHLLSFWAQFHAKFLYPQTFNDDRERQAFSLLFQQLFRWVSELSAVHKQAFWFDFAMPDSSWSTL